MMMMTMIFSSAKMIDIPFPMGNNNQCALIAEISDLLDIENGPWVAGGIMRRILTSQFNDPHDIDVFFASTEQQKTVGKLIRERECSFMKKMGMVISEEPPEFGLMVAQCSHQPGLQLIKEHLYGDLPSLFSSFDFTICAMATDGKVIRCHDRALGDIRDKLLFFINGDVTSPGRVIRYFCYGYEPSPGVLDILIRSPEQIYYSVGFSAFGEAIQEIYDADLSDVLLLGKMADLVFTHVGKHNVCLLKGFPMPSQMAFVYIVGRDRREIKSLMSPVRQKWNLALPDATGISVEKFIEKYRATL